MAHHNFATGISDIRSVDSVGHQAGCPLPGSGVVDGGQIVGGDGRSSAVAQHIGLPAVAGVALDVSAIADHAQQHLCQLNAGDVAVGIELAGGAFVPAAHDAQVGGVVDVAFSPVARGNIGVNGIAFESSGLVVLAVVLQDVDHLGGLGPSHVSGRVEVALLVALEDVESCQQLDVLNQGSIDLILVVERGPSHHGKRHSENHGQRKNFFQSSHGGSFLL